MRKIISLVICILMIAMLAVPAMAAETAVPSFELELSPDPKATVLYCGSELTITVKVAETAPCHNFGVIIDYDPDVFAFESVDSDENAAGMDGSFVSDPDELLKFPMFSELSSGKALPGVGAWNNKKDSSGNVPASSPSGVVGIVKLKVLQTLNFEEGSDELTSWIKGIARVNGGSDDEGGGTEATVVNGEVSVTVKKGMLGDVTGDGKVNIGDVAKLRRYLAYGDAIKEANADTTGDGKINIGDVAKLRRHLAYGDPLGKK